jgi:pimeloyl-ACP methyl ester carboxylesterase
VTATPPVRTRTFASPQAESAFFGAYDRVLAKWPVPVEPVDVVSPYGVTRVNVAGPAGAPAVVLLAGGGATSTVWFGNVGPLARTHRVYAVDLIGDPGRSVHNGQPLKTVDDLVSWLDGVLVHCGLESAALAGHSYGGWIALSYALRRPERVSRLALVDPSSCFAGMSPGYLLHGVPVMLGHSGDRMRSLLRWETGGAALDPDWLDVVARGTGDFPSSTVVLPRRPTADQLRGLAIPTLVLVAQRSRSHNVARLMATAQRLLPDVRTAVLPGATHHTLPLHEPAELNRYLTEFLM